MISLNHRIIIVLSSTLALLLIPLIAMQFTDEVNWSPQDFLVMGLLLFGLGSSIELILRRIKKIEYRIILLGLALLTFLLIWAELAVGIFGTPFAGS
ncbi:MAG: hypothetical protein ACFB15_11990 [Cyclobacteriaceae bacterium]